MEYTVKRGFGPGGVKEYFVAQADGDTLQAVIAGPFESEAQCRQAIEALQPLFFRSLHCIGGHLVDYKH
jgi:hypothetical protein